MVKDWSYLASFKVKELPSLQQMITEINQTHNTDLIEDFNDRCERHIQGEKDAQFLEVTKSDDLVVTIGMQQTVNLILGTSPTRWTWMGFGTGGATAATTAQTALVAEISRINMSIMGQGWREFVGMKLFFGAIGSERTVTATFTEVGVFTDGTPSAAMLNRNAFPNNGIAHVFEKSATIISSVIEFCPVA